MLIKDLKQAKEFIAGDKTKFREILHPDKEDLKINYSLGEAKLGPGQASLPHKLKSSEVYFILEGQGKMHINQEIAEVHAGQAVYIPPNASQYIENTGDSDLRFLCLVNPAWKVEDEGIL